MDSDKAKGSVSELYSRIEEYKIENSSLKYEKEKISHKLDLINEENANLRNEVYMLKKLMLEYDKREMKTGTFKNLDSDHNQTANESNFRAGSSHSNIDSRSRNIQAIAYNQINQRPLEPVE